VTLDEATGAALATDAAIARAAWRDLQLRPEVVDGAVIYNVQGEVACAPIVAATLPRRERQATDWEVRAQPCA